MTTFTVLGTLIGTAMLAGAALTPVSIKLRPSVVMVGGAVRVTCSVPRRDTNRGITASMWIEGSDLPFRSMFDQLDGSDSRVTHEFLFEHVPCFAFAASCKLEAQSEQAQFVKQTIQVAGCEQ